MKPWLKSPFGVEKNSCMILGYTVWAKKACVCLMFSDAVLWATVRIKAQNCHPIIPKEKQVKEMIQGNNILNSL